MVAGAPLGANSAGTTMPTFTRPLGDRRDPHIPVGTEDETSLHGLSILGGRQIAPMECDAHSRQEPVRSMDSGSPTDDRSCAVGADDQPCPDGFVSAHHPSASTSWLSVEETLTVADLPGRCGSCDLANDGCPAAHRPRVRGRGRVANCRGGHGRSRRPSRGGIRSGTSCPASSAGSARRSAFAVSPTSARGRARGRPADPRVRGDEKTPHARHAGWTCAPAGSC